MKDRLAEFLSLAEQYDENRRYSDESDAGPSFSDQNYLLFETQADWTPMESFLQPVHEIESEITTLKVLLEQIHKVHQQMLISPGIHPDVTKSWSELISNFTAISKTVNARIKDLTKVADRLEESPTHNRIKHNHIMVLNRAIRTILFRFNAERNWYREKCKERMISYIKIVNNNTPESRVEMTEDEMDEAIDNGQLFSTKSLMMGNRERRFLYDDVQNRHQELQKLETSIIELHEMFLDLHMLVESQGEMLNNIETNVNNAANYARQANRNVVKARAARQRNVKLRIVICVISVILIFIFLLMLAGTFCFYLPFVCR